MYNEMTSTVYNRYYSNIFTKPLYDLLSITNIFFMQELKNCEISYRQLKRQHIIRVVFSVVYI